LVILTVPYLGCDHVKGSKNDANDTAAICEAVTIRGHMAELGIIAAKGRNRNGIAELLTIIANAEDDQIPTAARFCLDVLARQYAALAMETGAIEKRIRVRSPRYSPSAGYMYLG
jgi:hypothetical protein